MPPKTSSFWATVCKTVRPMLWDRCLSVCPVSLSVCLSVCNVGVVWPNGWMDQDETRHGGRPGPWPKRAGRLHHHHLYSSKTHNTKAVIENCGQVKLGNSTYNCPKNRHKSIKTTKHKNS